MGQVRDQRFGDAVAEIVGIGISAPIGEGEHGDGIDVNCPTRSQVPSATTRHQSDGGDASGYDDPELATLERLVGRCLVLRSHCGHVTEMLGAGSTGGVYRQGARCENGCRGT